MSGEREQVVRIDEGFVKKGGVNERFQIDKRPPPPAPLRPPEPERTSPTAAPRPVSK